MPLSGEGRERTFRQNVQLAVMLAFVAGAVNAAGFFVLGTHTSHVSGHVAAVGEHFASGEARVAVEGLKLLAFFVLGAVAAAFLLDLTADRRRARYVPALLVETIVLAGVALWAGRASAPTSGMARGLLFAMGLQNALVTRISGAVVRTTHLTGVLTDLGIEIVEVARSRRLTDRLWLHFSIASSFLVGATVGPFFVLRWGATFLAVPCIVLVGLIALDWRTVRAERTSAG